MQVSKMDEIVRYSRERIENGSKSFAAAARLFDADTRAHAYMLYAWCRHCDDVIDGQELGFADGEDRQAVGRQAAGGVAREDARRAVRGEWDEMVFGALHRVVRERGLPERYLLDHLDGFAMDVEGRRYETPR